MIDFVKLQHIMKKQLDEDRKIRIIDASGKTLDAALSEAGTLLDLPVRRLEYEIIERGFNGIFGTGRKDWKIRAYANIRESITKTGLGSLSGEEESVSAVVVNKPGEIFVLLSSDGDSALLKVKAPLGSGSPATEEMAMQALMDRNVKDINESLVHSVVENADGEYIKVGSFTRNYAHDSSIRVEVMNQDMQACIIVEPPGTGGCDLSSDVIIDTLRKNRVVVGIKKEAVDDFVDHPVYKLPVVVAEGQKEVNGRNAYIEYLFKTSNKLQLRENREGRVDFKDLQIIQNVVENQPVAKKIPAQEGVKGRTVRGDYLPAKDGVDIQLPLGKNVHADETGMIILADMNGQVTLAAGTVNVEPVFLIQGNVGLKTGNIIFLGNVIVTGNVEDGFSVKAAGNIHVKGTVESAELEAEGEVVVTQGISGKNTGTVKAGKAIWARFIENAIVDAGTMVVVSDGIINSQVDAYKRIVCHGKRARIVGGRLRASEEINAQVIGSSSGGTETICEVGIDPKIKETLEQLASTKIAKEKELDGVQEEAQELINIKVQRKSLPEEKEFLLNELIDQRNALVEELKKINSEILKQQDAQDNLKTRGRVSASNMIHPGTIIKIREIVENIRSEYRSATFVLEDGLIRAIKYEAPDEEIKKGPESIEE